ncbi:MAG: hypothetical protein WC478_03110 [Candidatus Omnitrophota bacterium]
MNRIIPLKFNLRHSDKVHKLKDDLEKLFLIIRDAHCAYEIWWILVSKDGRREYSHALYNFKDFFEPIMRANSTTMFIALFKLYDERNDTLNLIKLLENAESLGVIDLSKNIKLKRKKSEVKKIWKKICILRNNVLAHRSYLLTVKEVYRLADINPNKIKRMIDLSLKIFNSIWMKIEKDPKQLGEFTYMDTVRILETLQAQEKR